jgi:hypothetical protein
MRRTIGRGQYRAGHADFPIPCPPQGALQMWASALGLCAHDLPQGAGEWMRLKDSSRQANLS